MSKAFCIFWISWALIPTTSVPHAVDVIVAAVAAGTYVYLQMKQEKDANNG